MGKRGSRARSHRHTCGRFRTSRVAAGTTAAAGILRGNRTAFDLNLDFIGTEFQKRVWNALLMIPFGQTRSYAQIASERRAEGRARRRRREWQKSDLDRDPMSPADRIERKSDGLCGWTGCEAGGQHGPMSLPQDPSAPVTSLPRRQPLVVRGPQPRYRAGSQPSIRSANRRQHARGLARWRCNG